MITALARFLGFMPIPLEPEKTSEYGTPLKLIPEGYWEEEHRGRVSILTKGGVITRSWTPLVEHGWLHDRSTGSGWSSSSNIDLRAAPKPIQPWLRYRMRLLFNEALDSLESLSGRLALEKGPDLQNDIRVAIRQRREALQRMYDYIGGCE